MDEIGVSANRGSGIGVATREPPRRGRDKEEPEWEFMESGGPLGRLIDLGVGSRAAREPAR